MKPQILRRTDELSSSANRKPTRISSREIRLFVPDREFRDQPGMLKSSRDQSFTSEFQLKRRYASVGCLDDSTVICSCKAFFSLCEFSCKSHTLLNYSNSDKRLPSTNISKHQFRFKRRHNENTTKTKLSNRSLDSLKEDFHKDEDIDMRKVTSRCSIPFVSCFSEDSNHTEQSKQDTEIGLKDRRHVQHISKISSFDFDISSQSSSNSELFKEIYDQQNEYNEFCARNLYEIKHENKESIQKIEDVRNQSNGSLQIANEINFCDDSLSKSSSSSNSDYFPEFSVNSFATNIQDSHFNNKEEELIACDVRNESVLNFEKEESSLLSLYDSKYQHIEQSPQKSENINKRENIRKMEISAELLDSNTIKESSIAKLAFGSNTNNEPSSINKFGGFDRLVNSPKNSSFSLRSFQSSTSYKSAVDRNISIMNPEETESPSSYKSIKSTKKDIVSHGENKQHLELPGIIDMKKYDKIDEEIKVFSGTHDFSSFNAERNKDLRNNLTRTANREYPFLNEQKFNFNSPSSSSSYRSVREHPREPRLNILKMNEKSYNPEESQIQSSEHSETLHEHHSEQNENVNYTKNSKKNLDRSHLNNAKVSRIETNTRPFSSALLEENKEKGYEENDTPSFKLKQSADSEYYINESIQFPGLENQFSFNLNSPVKADPDISSLTNLKEDDDKELEGDTSLPLRHMIDIYAHLELSEPRNVWQFELSDLFCSCFIEPVELDEKILCTIEHFLRFSYVKFSFEDEFHIELLNSCMVELGFKALRFIDTDEPLRYFTQCNEYSVSLSKSLESPYALVSLFFLRILVDHLPGKLETMLSICTRSTRNCPLFLVFIEISNFIVRFVSKKKNNHFITDKEEVVEKFFFFYTGILIKWFEEYENTRSSWENCKKITRFVMKYAKLHVEEIIHRTIVLKVHSD